MRLLILLICLTVPVIANAGVRLTMGGGVYHIADREHKNEANYLILMENRQIMGGTFVNSRGVRSYTIAYSARYSAGDLDFSTNLGLVHGYGAGRVMQCVAGWCLYAAPSATYWVRSRWGVTGVVFGQALVYGLTVRF